MRIYRRAGTYAHTLNLRETTFVYTLCPLLNELEERPWRQPRAGGMSSLALSQYTRSSKEGASGYRDHRRDRHACPGAVLHTCIITLHFLLSDMLCAHKIIGNSFSSGTQIV